MSFSATGVLPREFFRASNYSFLELRAFRVFRGESHLSSIYQRRLAVVPVRCVLVRRGGIEDGLIGERGADQLHTDGQAVWVDAAGERAAGQAEHAREAQQIGLVVTYMP